MIGPARGSPQAARLQRRLPISLTRSFAWSLSIKYRCPLPQRSAFRHARIPSFACCAYHILLFAALHPFPLAPAPFPSNPRIILPPI